MPKKKNNLPSPKKISQKADIAIRSSFDKLLDAVKD